MTKRTPPPPRVKRTPAKPKAITKPDVGRNETEVTAAGAKQAGLGDGSIPMVSLSINLPPFGQLGFTGSRHAIDILKQVTASPYSFVHGEGSPIDQSDPETHTVYGTSRGVGALIQRVSLLQTQVADYAKLKEEFPGRKKLANGATIAGSVEALATVTGLEEASNVHGNLISGERKRYHELYEAVRAYESAQADLRHHRSQGWLHRFMNPDVGRILASNIDEARKRLFNVRSRQALSA